MKLVLRQIRVTAHDQNMYRVLTEDGTEIGSISLVLAAWQRQDWRWGIDFVFPVDVPTRGRTDTREAAISAFRAAWDQFAADPTRLAAFLRAIERARTP